MPRKDVLPHGLVQHDNVSGWILLPGGDARADRVPQGILLPAGELRTGGLRAGHLLPGRVRDFHVVPLGVVRQPDLQQYAVVER